MWFVDRLRSALTPSPSPSPVGSEFALVPKLAGGGRATAGRNVMPDLSVWQQFQRVGGGLTPMQVSNIIREADTGRMASLMDLANEVRQKDCHLQCVLSTSEESIAGLEWELVDPEDSKLRERKAAGWAALRLRGCRSFSRFVAHHAGAPYYGYAVSEIDWQNVGAEIYPRAFLPRAHRRFIHDSESGRFHWWDSNVGHAYPGIDIEEAYPDKFVISRPRVNGDVPCREGLVRPLVWAALFRNWDLGDWLKLGEVAWKPWRWGTYAKNTGDDEIAQLISTLEGMASSTVAAFPETSKITVEWPKGSPGGTSSHRELYQTIAGEMSKAVLGQTLTTEQQGVGSYAMAKVHDGVRRDLREARAKSIAGDIDRYVIGPMVRLNYGPHVRPPTFRFITEDASDLVSFSAGVKALVEAGLRIPAVWARNQAGIPEPDAGEELVGIPGQGANDNDSIDVNLDDDEGAKAEALASNDAEET